MAGYYDIVLGLIPLAMVGITGTLMAIGVELTVAIPLASVVAVALIGHAMFVRAPVDPPRKREPPQSDSSQADPPQSEPIQSAD